jgi:hypothetical protein
MVWVSDAFFSMVCLNGEKQSLWRGAEALNMQRAPMKPADQVINIARCARYAAFLITLPSKKSQQLPMRGSFLLLSPYRCL